MNQESKKTHGGARKGAGRKPRTGEGAVAVLDDGKIPYVRVDRALGVREEFEKLLASAGATDKKLSQRIAEGLDAQETVFAKFEGRITDSRDVIAWGERRAYADMICKIKRLVTNADEAPKELPSIQVNIVHIGAPAQLDEPQVAVNIRHVDKD